MLEDRRLDEWVQTDVIDRHVVTDASVVAGPSTSSQNEEEDDSAAQQDVDDGKKVTRNMKRKFDEMNYKKVCDSSQHYYCTFGNAWQVSEMTRHLILG